jgi:hypothetical protein
MSDTVEVGISAPVFRDLIFIPEIPSIIGGKGEPYSVKGGYDCVTVLIPLTAVGLRIIPVGGFIHLSVIPLLFVALIIYGGTYRGPSNP